MEPIPTGLLPFSGPAEVTALSLHPVKALVSLATASPSGYEIVEADAVSGDVFKRVNAGRRVRMLRHLETRDGVTYLMIAFERGDMELWDSETMAVKDRIVATKKEDGKSVIAWSFTVDSGSPHVYISRGGSSLERIVLMEKRGKALRNDYKNWKPITVIETQPGSSLVLVGLADGEVKIVDGKTLHQSSQSLSPSSVDPRFAQFMRSAVTSISCHPQQDAFVAVSHAHGSVALWNLKKDTFEGLLPQSSGSRQLVDVHFHAWLPSLYSLFDDGTLQSWSVVAGPRGMAVLDAPLQTSHLASIERSFYSRTYPCSRCWPMAGASKLHLHPRLNLLTVTPRRLPAHIHASNPAACSLPLMELIDPAHPTSTLVHCTSLSIPSPLALDRPSPHVVFPSAHFFFLHGLRLKAYSLALSRTADVGHIPPTDAAGRVLRPLLLSSSAAWGVVTVAVQSSGGDRSVVALPVGRPDDSEDGGREMFFHGIGTFGGGGSVDGRSNRGEAVDDVPMATLPGRDACFLPGGSLALLAADGHSITLHSLPPLHAGGEPPDVREWFGKLQARMPAEVSQDAIALADCQLARVFAPEGEGGAEAGDRLLGYSQATRQVLLFKKGWEGDKGKRGAWGVGSVQLADGEALVQASWQVGGRLCALATTERMLILTVPEAELEPMQVQTPLWRRGLGSCLWFGRGLLVTDRTHMLSVTQRGTVECLAALETAGGTLCCVLPDRVVYVVQEAGKPVVVTRAVGMVDSLVRSCLQEDAVSEAEEVLDKYDKSRMSVDTLTAMCRAGMGASSLQIVKEWMDWLPWLSRWKVAAEAGEHRLSIAMLERRVAEKKLDASEAAELFEWLAHRCGEQAQLKTAAACLVRAGRCGSKASFWALLDMVDAVGGEEGWRDLMSVAAAEGEEYLRVACGVRLKLSPEELAQTAKDRGAAWCRDGAPWSERAGPGRRKVSFSDQTDADERSFGLTDAARPEARRRVVANKPFGKPAPRVMARVQTKDGEAELDGVNLGQMAAWTGVRVVEGGDESVRGADKVSRRHSLESSEDGSTTLSTHQPKPFVPGGFSAGAPMSEDGEGPGAIPEVDEEGYVIRPTANNGGSSMEDVWGADGSDDEGTQHRSQIKVEIKEASEATAASADELAAAMKGISLGLDSGLGLGPAPTESKTRSKRRGGRGSGSASTPLAPMDAKADGPASASTPLPPMDPPTIPPFPATSSNPNSPSKQFDTTQEELGPSATGFGGGEQALWQAFGDDDGFGQAGGFGDGDGGFGAGLGFEDAAPGFGDIGSEAVGFGDTGFGGAAEGGFSAGSHVGFGDSSFGDGGALREDGFGQEVASTTSPGGASGFGHDFGPVSSSEAGGAGRDGDGVEPTSSVDAGGGWVGFGGDGGSDDGFGGGGFGDGASSVGCSSPVAAGGKAVGSEREDAGSVGGGMGFEADGFGNVGDQTLDEGDGGDRMTPSPPLDEDSSSMEDGQQGGGGMQGFTPPESSTLSADRKEDEPRTHTKFTRHVRGLSDPKALEGVAEIVMSVENQNRHAFNVSPVEMEARFHAEDGPDSQTRRSPLELLNRNEATGALLPTALDPPAAGAASEQDGRAAGSKFQLFDDDDHTIRPFPPAAAPAPALSSEPPKRPPPPPPPKAPSPGKVLFPVLRKTASSGDPPASPTAAATTGSGDGEAAHTSASTEEPRSGDDLEHKMHDSPIVGMGEVDEAAIVPVGMAGGAGDDKGEVAEETGGWVSFGETFGGSDSDDFA